MMLVQKQFDLCHFLFKYLVILTSLILSGCGEPQNEHQANEYKLGAFTIGDAQWEPCSLFNGIPAECTAIEVPLRWDEPHGSKIEIFIKRKLLAGSNNQVWLLAGGPGGSSLALEPNVMDFATRGNADVYLFEHRGVGASSRLSCPSGEADDSVGGFFITPDEYPDCIQYLKQTWKKDLFAFNITEAARDLGEIIDKVRDPSKKLFVYGVSYGTYWAHRYLLQYPQQADGIILDSVLAPFWPNTHLGFNFGYPIDVHITGLKLMRECKKDQVCRHYLGNRPTHFLRKLLADMKQGHCQAAAQMGLTPTMVRYALGAAIGNTTLRNLAPALIYRLRRCNEKDLQALLHYQQITTSMTPFGEAMNRQSSPMLRDLVSHSEFWLKPGPSPEEYARLIQHLLFVWGTPVQYIEYIERLPTYKLDEYVGPLADTDVPMLMLSGTMDSATPLYLGLRLFRHFNKPNQNWVRVERAGHIVMNQSRFADPTDPRKTCGWHLYQQFMQNPKASLNTSCRTQVEPYDFAGNPSMAQIFFGTDSYYQNTDSAWSSGDTGSEATLPFTLNGFGSPTYQLMPANNHQ